MRQLTYILIALVIVGVYADEPEKLVNGIPTTIEEYPHCVSLRRNNRHICGGSIINSRFILTAAHCLAGLSVKDPLTVVTGTTKLSSGGDIHRISKIWSHEDYSASALGRPPGNDIGLIKLTEDIAFNSRQQPIELPTKDVTKDEGCTIAAWGSAGLAKPVHDGLQKLDSQTILTKICQSYYDERFMPIDEKEFCTLIKTGTGLCHGDSGSGVVRHSDKAIIGLVSGGKPCARGSPDIYTNVYSYIPWIKRKLRL